jgi:protein TonB
MKYQALPKWDKNRPIYLKLGFILAIGFVLMAFNYTSYPVGESYDTNVIWEDETLEIIPPRTPKEPKTLPPPPIPKIETVIEIEPEDDPTFVETKPEEIFDEPTKDSDATVDDYATPIKHNTPSIVAPIIKEETLISEGPVPIADRMPVYGECSLDDDESVRRACTNKSVMETIYSNVKYPTIALENDITGTVIVSFVVAKDGKISNIEIVRDIGGGCGKAVVKAMKKLGQFYPGKHNGRPISVIYKLPVKFKLQ